MKKNSKKTTKDLQLQAEDAAEVATLSSPIFTGLSFAETGIEFTTPDFLKLKKREIKKMFKVERAIKVSGYL